MKWQWYGKADTGVLSGAAARKWRIILLIWRCGRRPCHVSEGQATPGGIVTAILTENSQYRPEMQVNLRKI
ncbi:MAG TPA: hypothetical protein PKI62_10870 [bacterium]|nr:hypothetical protein [bacterium]HPR89253.1 hypothetical protein [bacterium]